MECTSGFGMHSVSTGHKYLLTDGHCHPDYFYNYDWVANTYGSLMGVTVTGSDPMETSASGAQVVDAQALDPGSGGSSCISWGGVSVPPSPLVRYYITGYNQPSQGLSILSEGAHGYEKSGTVSELNLSFPETYNGKTLHATNLFSVAGGSTVEGDSGGSMIQPSLFGPLAAGIVWGSAIKNGQTYTIGTMINAIRFIYQADPNVSSNGTNC
ncbi:hypothetical protein [Pseudofrankia sp. DC12]|uniref:hypothetical protein n=1 Tax=Pseudofrankia sp. DC12 TaxID=683315 RepID=UPI000B1D6A62|nr:hypothetical protein [Pseudofrankia sp. DC12]